METSPLPAKSSLACHAYCDKGRAASVYNGHFRGPVTFTPIAERLAVELSVPGFFFDLLLSRLRFEHPAEGLRGQRSNPLYHRRNHDINDEVIVMGTLYTKYHVQEVYAD